ncbi:hypothetical protein ACVBEJ_09070 [Porticoccus sp. GXU_MW_L64]
MVSFRKEGAEHPGIKWGPFTLRIPFVHTRATLSELLQGIFIAAATAMALVPLLVSAFGLSFEEAVTMAMLHAILLSSAWMFFGEPYCPGWITPALPFVITFVVAGDFSTPGERFQAMTALSLDFAAILLLLGVTGLGARLMSWIPEVLKGGIILGAAMAAFMRVLDSSDSTNALFNQPYATTAALVLAMVLTFSLPLKRLQQRYPLIAKIASLGLLPGFFLAGLIGAVSGEITFNIEWGILNPPFASLWEKVSPLSIGWPSASLYLQCLPLALIAYVILFGDIVTGNAIIKQAQDDRKDETISLNTSRTHISTGIRNAVMAIVAPFFPSQGVLWTGIQVIVVERWRQGRQTMDSLFDGISSYYVFNVPLLFILLPLITLLRPLMSIALLMTLLLTGIACANVALNKAKTQVDYGVMLLTATSLNLFTPWQGLLIGIVAIVLLVGWKRSDEGEAL